MKIMLIVGVRPQIIKAAPVIQALINDSEIDLQLVHSGQHYDYKMSKVFFENFSLPDPKLNLGVGSGSHASQTSNMMLEIEKTIKNLNPEIVIVVGDANTTLAGALVAVKMQVAVGHIEAGLRSYEMSMPEEVNRVLVDHCSSMLFAPTKTAVSNLLKEGISKQKIFLTGDTMVDVLYQNINIINNSRILERLQVNPEEYAVLTMHRQENVDNISKLRAIVDALTAMDNLRIIFPIHPRTKKNLEKNDFIKRFTKRGHIKMVEPLNYRDMLKLINESKLVLTDSGGIQKEAFLLRVPCITLRNNTEWVETVHLGANILVGTNREQIVEEIKKTLIDKKVKSRLWKLRNPFGDGKSSERIINILKKNENSINERLP